jgi:hypothetical protein
LQRRIGVDQKVGEEKGVGASRMDLKAWCKFLK